MEQKKQIGLHHRQLHTGDIIRYRGALHQIGTMGTDCAFAEKSMGLIELKEAEPIVLSDVETLKQLRFKTDGWQDVDGKETLVVTFKCTGLNIKYTYQTGNPYVEIVIMGAKGFKRNDARKVGLNDHLHELQQLVWIATKKEMEIIIPKQK